MSLLTIQVDSNAAQLMMRLERMPERQRNGISRGLQRALLVTEDKVRRGTAVKFRRGGSGLAGRLTSYVRPAGETGIEAAIGFRKTRNFPYELSQEFGAKAKAGGAMSIPISPEAKALSARGQGPRAMGDRLVMIKGKARVLLVEERKRGSRGIGRTDIHWVLVKAIPARLKFRETVTGSIPMISEEIVKGWQEGIRNA